LSIQLLTNGLPGRLAKSHLSSMEYFFCRTKRGRKLSCADKTVRKLWKWRKCALWCVHRGCLEPAVHAHRVPIGRARTINCSVLSELGKLNIARKKALSI